MTKDVHAETVKANADIISMAHGARTIRNDADKPGTMTLAAWNGETMRVDSAGSCLGTSASNTHTTHYFEIAGTRYALSIRNARKRRHLAYAGLWLAAGIIHAAGAATGTAVWADVLPVSPDAANAISGAIAGACAGFAAASVRRWFKAI